MFEIFFLNTITFKKSNYFLKMYLLFPIMMYNKVILKAYQFLIDADGRN